MAVTIRGQEDDDLLKLRDALVKYVKEHPKAYVVLYRQNSASIRVRILDPDFKNIDWAERHDQVWNYFEHLSDWVQFQVSILLLLTPKEAKKSLANLDFEDPIPSEL